MNPRPAPKIALVSSLYHPYHVGGAELTTRKIAEGLARRGYEVDVITLGDRGAIERESHNGVNVVRLPLAESFGIGGTVGRYAALHRELIASCRTGASARSASGTPGESGGVAPGG